MALSMTDEPRTLHAYWGARRLTIERCAEILMQFVDALPAVDPIFESWIDTRTGRPKFPIPLEPDNAIRVATKAQKTYDRPKRPWPEMGFSLSGGNRGPARFQRRLEYAVATIMMIGAYNSDNSQCNCIDIWIGKKRIATEQAWRASELKSLMRVVLDVWRPREMSVDADRYAESIPEVEDNSYAAGRRRLTPWTGWLTYLPADLAAKVTIPSEIGVERLEDGGLIATLCEEPFTVDNPVHMARARALEAAIRPVQS